MRKLILATLVVTGAMVGRQLAYGQQPAPAGAKAFKELHRAEMDSLLATPDRVLVLDVRSPGEIAYWGAFPVFLSIQAEEGDQTSAGVEAHLAAIPKDKPIVTVSGRANRGGFAAAMLARHGFTVAGTVGAMTYAEEGGQLVKFKPYTHWSMNGGKPPAGYAEAQAAPKSFKELHRAEIEALMAKPDEVFVVDVRSPGEVAYWGGFPVFLDLQAEEGDTSAKGVGKVLSQIPKDKPIVTVSGRANRSGFAAALLANNGYRVLGAIGVMTYGEEGGHLVKYQPYKPPAASATSPK